MKLNWLKTCAAVILIGLAVYFLNQGHYWTVLGHLKWTDVVISFGLCFLVFLLTSWRNGYLLRRKYGVKLSYFDLITLPITMNLWGIILPIQGSLLYFIFFLKNKYRMRAAEGTAMVLYTYLITFILAGLFLAAYSYFKKDIAIGITGIIFILSPVIVYVLNALLQVLPGNWKIFKTLKDNIGRVQASSQEMLSDFQTNLFVILMTILRLVVRSVWYYAAAQALGIDVSLPVAIILALINDFTSIIRLIPGNFGVDEILSGAILVAFGGQMGAGVVLTILIRFVTLAYTFSVGIWSTLVNLPYFGSKNFSNFWQTLRSEKTENAQ